MFETWVGLGAAFVDRGWFVVALRAALPIAENQVLVLPIPVLRSKRAHATHLRPSRKGRSEGVLGKRPELIAQTPNAQPIWRRCLQWSLF